MAAPEITDAMVERGLRVLYDSGAFKYQMLSDHILVAEIFGAMWAARPTPTSSPMPAPTPSDRPIQKGL